jgi:hypothetical protein
MALLPGTVGTLVRVELLTLGLAALFALAGRPLVRRFLPAEPGRDRPVGFVFGSAFFLGLTGFLVLFVLAARLAGSARIGLWVALAGVGAAALVELPRLRRTPVRVWLPLAASLAGLIAVFSVTTATLWLPPNPAGPDLMSYFGSIHSGRYANYAVYIARHDRIPFLAQNVGQSLLAAAELLLGIRAPLAVLMAWLPVALAALTVLVFGFLRDQGLSTAWALGGAFFTLGCNIALSLVHLMVLDNGSPLAFAGYTDVISGGATYLLACVWFRGLLLGRGPGWSVGLAVPLGLLWAWCAPQNVIVAAVTGAAAGLVWVVAAWPPRRAVLLRLGAAAALFAGAVAGGATQLGTFLPPSWREDVGMKTFLAEGGVRARPYVVYVTSHWTNPAWNYPFPAADRLVKFGWPGLYESNFADAEPHGRPAVLTSTLGVFEASCWTSLRAYGFLLVGLVLLGWRARTGTGFGVWFWLALGTFLTGYAIAFGLELNQTKWWLSRLLVPAAVVCLAAVPLALAPPAGTKTPWSRRCAWGLLLLAGTCGPLVEFGLAFRLNWVTLDAFDPLAHRLNRLAHTPGPFEDLTPR